MSPGGLDVFEVLTKKMQTKGEFIRGHGSSYSVCFGCARILVNFREAVGNVTMQFHRMLRSFAALPPMFPCMRKRSGESVVRKFSCPSLEEEDEEGELEYHAVPAQCCTKHPAQAQQFGEGTVIASRVSDCRQASGILCF